MPHVAAIECIFLGTGSAQQSPNISRLLSRNGSVDHSLMSNSKDTRGTSSAIIKVTLEDQSFKTILIDCGPTFYRKAVEIFPKHGIRQIDAVLLTHEHGDATSGLASLQAWVTDGRIQKDILIMANEKTFDECCVQWPFLQHPSKPLDSAANPAFHTRLIQDDKPFELWGTTVTPLPAHHGMMRGKPNICLGYLFSGALAYMSDSNWIPETTWHILEKQAKQLPVLVTETLRLQAHPSHFGFSQAVSTARRTNAFHTYFTQIAPSFSHDQWVKICQRVQSGRPALKSHKGVADQVTYNDNAFEALLSRTGLSKEDVLFKSLHEIEGIDLTNSQGICELAVQEVERWEGGAKSPLWIRPAYDGLHVRVDARTGEVRDSYVSEPDKVPIASASSTKGERRK